MLPTRRVVLLGASNLTRSFATVVDTIRRAWNEPVEIMAAMGHGRSFGQESSVLGRKISGIFFSPLWQDLARRAPLPTTALVTDIGNDLLQGVEVDQLVGWVEGCLDRLSEVDATTVVTELPMGSVARLGETRYRFFRRLLFPRSRLTLGEARERAAAVNRRVIAWGERKKTSVISASDAWYGFDPIHLRRRACREAWPHYLAGWGAGIPTALAPRATFWSRVYLACLAPQEQTTFGLHRSCDQPCGRLVDGTTISLY